MTQKLIVATPSKGRLQENANAFFARAGLELTQGRGARDYRGAIAGLDGAEVGYLSASEITRRLAQRRSAFRSNGRGSRARGNRRSREQG